MLGWIWFGLLYFCHLREKSILLLLVSEWDMWSNTLPISQSGANFGLPTELKTRQTNICCCNPYKVWLCLLCAFKAAETWLNRNMLDWDCSGNEYIITFPWLTRKLFLAFRNLCYESQHLACSSGSTLHFPSTQDQEPQAMRETYTWRRTYKTIN